MSEVVPWHPAVSASRASSERWREREVGRSKSATTGWDFQNKTHFVSRADNLKVAADVFEGYPRVFRETIMHDSLVMTKISILLPELSEEWKLLLPVLLQLFGCDLAGVPK